jgi:DNA-binding protein YbaB
VTSPLQDQIARAMAALREQQTKLGDARLQLQRTTVAVTAKDRSVTVVVGGQGEVREFKFHTDDYRHMPPAELSALLVELITSARSQMSAKVAEAFGPLAGFGSTLRDSMIGGSELDTAFEHLREQARREPTHPDDEED